MSSGNTVVAWVRVAVSAVAVVLCAAPVWGEQAPGYGHEVQARLDALKAKGEPVTLADLTPEPIPPEENAATIYRQAFEAYVEPNEQVEEVQSKDFEDWTAEDLAEVRAWVEENQRAIALAKRAAAVEKCQFLDKYTGYDQKLPHLPGMRNMARLLLNSVILHLEDGLPKTALEEGWVQLRLVEHLGSEKELIEYLVGHALVSYARVSLQSVLGSPEAEGLDLGPVAQALEQLSTADRLTEVFRGECVFVLDAMIRPEDLGLDAQQAEALKTPGTLRTWLDSEGIATIEGVEKLVALAAKPWYQTAAERQNLDVWIRKGLLFRKLPLTRMLMPGLVRTLLRQAERQTWLAQMALGVELEMHRRAAGSYPDTLDDLKLTHLDEAPVDPCSGKPFRYRKEGEGYLLYSLGENGVDDDGERGSEWVPDREDPETGEWIEGRVRELDDIAWSVGAPVRRGERQAPSGPQEESQVGAPKAQSEPVTLEGGALEAIPPEENAATIYRQAFAAYVEPDKKVMELQAKHLEDRTREDVAVVRTWVEQNELAIARANQAAAMEKCQFLQRYTGVEYQYPHLRALGQLSVLLADSVWLHVQEGEPEAAFERCLVHLRMAEQLGQGDTLAEYLLEGALIDGARSSLQQVLDCAGVEHLDLKPLAASVRRLGDADRLIEALRHERTVKWKWLDHHIDHIEEWKDGYLEAAMAHRSSRTWVQREWRALAGLFVRIISLGDEPYYETTEQREELAAQLDLYNAQNLPLTAGLLPTMTRVLSVRAHRQANLRQMAFGIELEMHRRATGSYPDGLDGLKLTHLDEVPVDPFSGDAFHYVRREEGYLLYSVGPNGKDDAGTPRTPGADGPDDIPWTVSRAGE